MKISEKLFNNIKNNFHQADHLHDQSPRLLYTVFFCQSTRNRAKRTPDYWYVNPQNKSPLKAREMIVV